MGKDGSKSFVEERLKRLKKIHERLNRGNPCLPCDETRKKILELLRKWSR